MKTSLNRNAQHIGSYSTLLADENRKKVLAFCLSNVTAVKLFIIQDLTFGESSSKTISAPRKWDAVLSSLPVRTSDPTVIFRTTDLPVPLDYARAEWRQQTNNPSEVCGRKQGIYGRNSKQQFKETPARAARRGGPHL